MAKLSFTTDPTFTSRVDIPVAGKRPVPVEFTFIGRNRDEFRRYLDEVSAMDDADAVMLTISGWELEDPFGRETVEKLLLHYPGSARAITQRYINEVSGARLGN